MDAYLKDCHYEADYIDLLCEMTTFWEDPLLNGIAAQALFSIIIESLCDDFEELQTETYNQDCDPNELYSLKWVKIRSKLVRMGITRDGN